MLEMQVLELVETECGAPLLWALKKDDSPKFCVDYPKLNSLKERNSHPIPRVDKSIDSLRDALIFSKWDTNRGYWKLGIEEANGNQATFTSNHRLFWFSCMPFGPRNEPETFPWTMYVISSPCKWQVASLYLDDIIIISRTADQQVERVRTVLSLMHIAGTRLSLKKCRFVTEKFNLLGHLMRPGQLELASHTNRAIKDFNNLEQ